MKISQVLYYIFYTKIATYLPKTRNGSDGFFEKIRARSIKGFIDSCGNEINVQRRAVVARRISIGDYSGIGERCVIQGNVRIGCHVMMGPEVLIYTQNHDFSRVDITMDKQGFSEEKQVIIEDDVWIGARVIILPGVKIGRGSVIGAGSVVAKSIPEYSVAVGNPAKVVKRRKEI